MELSSSNIKEFLVFPQKEKNPEKIPYISGNGTFLYLRRTSQAPKAKIFYIFLKKVMNKSF